MPCHPKALWLLAAVAAAPAVENATISREEGGGIHSVYWDQRLDAGPARSGGVALNSATLSLRLGQEYVVWASNSSLVNPPGLPLSPDPKPLVEDRTVVEATLRQGFGAWYGMRGFLEAQGSVVQRTAELDAGTRASFDDNVITDPKFLVFIPIIQERYMGLSAGVGCSVSAGETSDWTTSHNTTGYLAALRGTSSVPGVSFLSAQASLDVTFASGAEQQLWTSPGEELVATDYSGLQAGLAVLYTASQAWTVGATWGYRVDEFADVTVPGVTVSSSETVRSSTLGLLVRARWPRQTFWTLTVSQEQLNGEADLDPRVGFSLETVPW